ncbi:unnamed protein product [Meganyctiphanes norvegica]|uniref:ATP synthase F(0) complex subunit e, mitochondrial n=1 Tax=Meganyctiphanes norvegica TaxID=48144 RepID=A0AAV2R840_MEGNR
MASLAAPVRVSPLIKTARWGCLIAGIYHGAKRHSELSVTEAALKIEEDKKQVIIAAQKAEEKASANRDELLVLGRACGIVPAVQDIVRRLNRDEMIYMANQAGVIVPEGF